MDPALKQRLVGAAVLVALAVILVPMLLEAPEPEATPAGQLSLDLPPRPELQLQTREVPLSLPPAAAEPDRVATVDIEVTAGVDALDESAPAAVAAEPAPSTPPPSAPEPMVPEPTVHAAVSQPAAPAARPEATAARPAAVTAPAASRAPSVAASPSAVTPASGRFVVNLGVFGNPDNAEALRQRLAGSGFPLRSESMELNGKPAQRLRAGPFRTRAEAEAAALRLGQVESGAKFSVGELDAAEPLPAAASRVAQGFAVQLGAFKLEVEAVALRDRLRAAGFVAYTERASTDAGLLWRVRAGPELQRERAETLQTQIRQRLKLDGIVVAHP